MSPWIPAAKLPVRLEQALTRSAVPLGAARVVVGAVVFARPTVLATSLGVDSAAARRTAWIARLFAGRDLALGVGSVSGSRGCRVAGVAADAADLMALLAAVRARQISPVIGTVAAITAAGSAAAGAAGVLAVGR